MSDRASSEITSTISQPAIESTFKPIVFTNQPDVETDCNLSMGRLNLKQWLGRMVRVTLKNKLILVGIFSCTDHDQNLVLSNCDKFTPNDEEPQSYGNVMVPGNQIATFEVDIPKDLDLQTEDTETI